MLAIPGAVKLVSLAIHQIADCRTVQCKQAALCLQPAQQLLRKGASNQETSDNLRVRADFLEGTDHASIDVRVLGESSNICTAIWHW